MNSDFIHTSFEMACKLLTEIPVSDEFEVLFLKQYIENLECDKSVNYHDYTELPDNNDVSLDNPFLPCNYIKKD